jgi:hypothetical protein
VARTKARRNGASGVAIPNALSKQDRIQAIANALMGLQRQELELTLLQQANGHDDGALVPGLPPELEGEPCTYANRRKVFKDGQMRLAVENRDLMSAVEAFIQGVHSQQQG